LEYYSFYNNFLRTHVIVHMSATYAKWMKKIKQQNLTV